MALDRALKTLALRGAGDLHALARLERLDGDGLAYLKLTGLVTELDNVLHRAGVGLLQMTELGLAQVLLLGRAERELHGLVAVTLVRADGRDRARAGLEHRDALDGPVL